jgi:hypothetical protein
MCDSSFMWRDSIGSRRMNILKTAIYITLLFIIFAGAAADIPDSPIALDIESFSVQKPAVSSAIDVPSYGLLATPGAIYESVDPFSACIGTRTCASFGLQRSTGNLCLSAAQRRLVYTRGGNLS